jgi:hypothetical protein
VKQELLSLWGMKEPLGEHEGRVQPFYVAAQAQALVQVTVEAAAMAKWVPLEKHVLKGVIFYGVGMGMVVAMVQIVTMVQTVAMVPLEHAMMGETFCVEMEAKDLSALLALKACQVVHLVETLVLVLLMTQETSSEVEKGVEHLVAEAAVEEKGQ